MGMNASRAFTLKYDVLLSIGRVQTPTLAILVKRRQEIENFTPEGFCTLTADFGDYQGVYFSEKLDPDTHLAKKEDAERIALECDGVDSLPGCLSAALSFTVSHRRAVYHIYSSTSRDIIEQYLMNICGYIVGIFIDKVSSGMQVPDEDKAAIIQFYKCECFGQIIDWLNHGMNTDMEKQFFRICELGRGITDEMLRRSAGEKQ